MTLNFTGREILAFGRSLPASCVVRNELNGWRKANQVVRTIGQTLPNGIAYHPRQFPPGEWEITRVVDVDAGSEYWPVFVDTAAIQILREWKLDAKGLYEAPAMKWFTDRGYGIHHAQYEKDGTMVVSNTTLGCINVKSPDDARWLADEIRETMGMRQRLYIKVPAWRDWK